MSSLPLAAPDPASALDEIRALVAHHLPPLPEAPAAAGLGDLAPVWQWLSSAQNRPRPGILRPRVALFMAAHGAYPERQEDLPGVLTNLKDGTHAVSPLVKTADADLQVYELDLATPSGDFRTGPALQEQDAARAISYGMMAVQPGIDLLLLCALNSAADAAAGEITRALSGKTDPLEALLRFGGLDIAAMAGAIAAARLARVPVILEGAAAQAAAGILRGLRADASAHAREASSLLREKTNLPPPCRGVMLIPLLKSLTQAV